MWHKGTVIPNGKKLHLAGQGDQTEEVSNLMYLLTNLQTLPDRTVILPCKRDVKKISRGALHREYNYPIQSNIRLGGPEQAAVSAEQ